MDIQRTCAAGYWRLEAGMIKTRTEPTLKHTARPWPPRPAAFVDLKSGALLHENGKMLNAAGGLDLHKILNAIRWDGWQESERPRIVYVVGGWNAASTPAPVWCEAPGRWERTSFNRDPFIASYKRDDLRVTIYCTAQWFGACSDVVLCQRAYKRLRQLLRGAFDQGVSLMGTPARTGLDLLERSLPCDKQGTPY